MTAAPMIRKSGRKARLITNKTELARLAEHRNDWALAATHYEAAWRIKPGERRLLLDPGALQAAGQRERAVVGSFQPGQDAQQAGLAGAVGPLDLQPLPRRDGEVHAGEQAAVTAITGKAVGLEHREGTPGSRSPAHSARGGRVGKPYGSRKAGPRGGGARPAPGGPVGQGWALPA